MIAVVFLLCAVTLQCSDGIAAQNPACVPSHEVACFVPADHQNASGSVSVEVCVGQKLIISLEHFFEFPVCHWIRGADPILTVNGSNSMVLPPLSETDSGEFTLSCETSEGTRSSLAVSLHVVMKRPTKPKLTLDGLDNRMRSPVFRCISGGFPKPTLKWSRNNDKAGVPANGVMAISSISSSWFSGSGVMCCATNAVGQECSQLYDYDLDTGDTDEVSNDIVSPGQSLLLRCRIKPSRRPPLVWEKGSKEINAPTCSSKGKNEICIRDDSYRDSRMSYLFIESVNVDHSGTYTCRSENNKTKSVDIHVQAEGFLSVQLDKSLIIPAQNASRSCLQASVSYHPVLQHCSWEAPDKSMTECIRDIWVTKHRTVKRCDVLKSGDYKLHLEAGGKKETKTISVCVVDKPKFRFRNEFNKPFTVETASLVPANYTWLSCLSSNDSICETDSAWKEIPEASQTDSDVFCEKTIKSSLSRDLVDGHELRFCLTNSIGSWCQTQINYASSPQPSKERPTKPLLTLDGLDNRMRSPVFRCISEGFPKPTLKWSRNNDKAGVPANSVMAISSISSSWFSGSGVMCCATNAVGQECSQLYDYDLDTGDTDEVSNDIVSPGQSLLLRCRIKPSRRPPLVWEKGSKEINAPTCSSKGKNEICIRDDSHRDSRMSYLFIESVNVDHSGTYTCRSENNKTKSVDVHVQAEGFLSVQLDKSLIIPAQNASRSCLQASVSYHPVLQHCSWEAPDKSMTECIRDIWVTKHRTVKRCDVLKSGDYKLHLEAGGKKETKTISVCVVDKPKFRFRNEFNKPFTVETASLVPANYTWLSCLSSNDSICETDSAWKEIPEASQTDSDVFCEKTIKSSLSRDLVDGHELRFCLTNSIGSWCQTQINYASSPQPSKGSANTDDGSLMLLKVGSLILLLALAIVSMVLMYFVKKKKPQYQPQLQIIQMVGPNDNDYIYINFKEFGYDQKWEFPRENLELGQELGSGAFGMVVQATAYGINKPGVSQQVAVKMLKEKHQTVEKEALMSELKMLTHIGQHANIVNMLGACTDSGPIYLIFQYCCYGDLQNYLKTNRERYHKSVTDAFNKDRFSSLYHNLQPRKSFGEIHTAVDNYVPMYSCTTRGQEDIALLTVNSGDMDGFEDPMIHEDLDDQTEDLQTLTFDDLLSFAFQVAKGMEFLSSKNCIHRDLAARNVLVTKGRRVKIGDFGLARDIDNDSNYVVRGNVRLPVKWMAPESTFQGIYTMKSDVWAYGILLWEIFSLGVTPYPGIKVDHMFYSMIERGFKMDCPYYANESVYGMMCKCWALDPSSRPSFSKLVSFMCDQLTDREEQLYHNMLDQTSSDYQNAAAILDISALTKQNENKTQSANDYCQTHATEESKAEVSDTDTVAADEKLVKPPVTE